MKKITLKIDSTTVEADENATILQAARSVGIYIPTLCAGDDGKANHRPSCMVCAVKIAGRSAFTAACSAPVEPGIEVVTNDAEIADSRRQSLEMLLSEHLGECEAPCSLACPLSWDIPAFMDALSDGKNDIAEQILSQQLPLAGVLGYLCHRPCEKSCRAAVKGRALAIAELHRSAAAQLANSPAADCETNASAPLVKIIGSGPAAISAATVLASCCRVSMVFGGDSLGGSLKNIADDQLPASVLADEISRLKSVGVELIQAQSLDIGDFDSLTANCNAAIIATGANSLSDDQLAALPDGVFAAGACAKPHSSKPTPIVRVVAAARDTAIEILEYLKLTDAPKGKQAIVRYGDLSEAEFDLLATRAKNQAFDDNNASELETTDAAAEAARCLLCGCAKADDCKLRQLASELGASTRRFTGLRKAMQIDDSCDELVFEPHKCILCGACVAYIGEKTSRGSCLTIQGRGISSTISSAYGKTLDELLGDEIDRAELVRRCPTAAIALKKRY